MNGILIVDDDREIRTLLRLLLTNAGYDVTEADGGDEAIRLLRGGDAHDEGGRSPGVRRWRDGVKIFGRSCRFRTEIACRSGT